MREGHAIDVQDAFSRFTLDSATEFLFGSCVHSLKTPFPYPGKDIADMQTLDGPMEPGERFARAFTATQEMITLRSIRARFWPLFEIKENVTVKAMKIINEYLNKILSEALTKHAENEKLDAKGQSDLDAKLDDEETLLDHLIKFTKGSCF